MASLCLNNCFNVPGERCVQILTIFSGMRCYGWAPTILIKSFILSTFAWWYLNRLWVGQSFNMITSSSTKLCYISCNLWHGAPLCWEITPSSKSNIKLSFCNWMYLALFKLLSILSNFLVLWLYMYLQSFLTFSLFSSCNIGHFPFLVAFLTNSSFIAEYDLMPSFCVP